MEFDEKAFMAATLNEEWMPDDVYNLYTDGPKIKKMVFDELEHDDPIPEVIDMEADSTKDVGNSYAGKMLCECRICKTLLTCSADKVQDFVTDYCPVCNLKGDIEVVGSIVSKTAMTDSQKDVDPENKLHMPAVAALEKAISQPSAAATEIKQPKNLVHPELEAAGDVTSLGFGKQIEAGQILGSNGMGPLDGLAVRKVGAVDFNSLFVPEPQHNASAAQGHNFVMGGDSPPYANSTAQMAANANANYGNTGPTDKIGVMSDAEAADLNSEFVISDEALDFIDERKL
jgi:hypothetical protein